MSNAFALHCDERASYLKMFVESRLVLPLSANSDAGFSFEPLL